MKRVLFCNTCVHFEEVPGQQEGQGVCLAHPPHLLGADAQKSYYGMPPVMGATSSCGEHARIVELGSVAHQFVTQKESLSDGE